MLMDGDKIFGAEHAIGCTEMKMLYTWNFIHQCYLNKNKSKIFLRKVAIVWGRYSGLWGR